MPTGQAAGEVLVTFGGPVHHHGASDAAETDCSPESVLEHRFQMRRLSNQGGHGPRFAVIFPEVIPVWSWLANPSLKARASLGITSCKDCGCEVSQMGAVINFCKQYGDHE